MSIWDEWRARQNEKIDAPKISELVKEPTPDIPKETMPITDRQRTMLILLQGVTFLPGSYDKRFARNVYSQTVITTKQSECLEKMFHRYRRQIANHKKICSICGRN